MASVSLRAVLLLGVLVINVTTAATSTTTLTVGPTDAAFAAGNGYEEAMISAYEADRCDVLDVPQLVAANLDAEAARGVRCPSKDSAPRGLPLREGPRVHLGRVWV